MEQTLWPPASIPICQKQKNGIESIFVDKEAKVPHNDRLPAASGKIGVVGKIELFQVRHPKDGFERMLLFVLRSEDPYAHAHVLGNSDAASGDPKRDVNQYSVRICSYVVTRTAALSRSEKT